MKVGKCSSSYRNLRCLVLTSLPYVEWSWESFVMALSSECMLAYVRVQTKPLAYSDLTVESLGIARAYRFLQRSVNCVNVTIYLPFWHLEMWGACLRQQVLRCCSSDGNDFKVFLVAIFSMPHSDQLSYFQAKQSWKVALVISHSLCIMMGLFSSSRNELNEDNAASSSEDLLNPNLVSAEEAAVLKVCDLIVCAEKCFVFSLPNVNHWLYQQSARTEAACVFLCWNACGSMLFTDAELPGRAAAFSDRFCLVLYPQRKQKVRMPNAYNCWACVQKTYFMYSLKFPVNRYWAAFTVFFCLDSGCLIKAFVKGRFLHTNFSSAWSDKGKEIR